MKPAKRRAWIVAVVMTGAAAQPAASQQTGQLRTGAGPEVTPQAWTVHEVTEDQKGVGAVDIGARFEEFQREFAEDFGVEHRSDEGGDLGARVEEAFGERWEGSAAFRWYERLVGVYDRFEGIYQRVERSTRWATNDFSVDPDLEAAVDGKLRLHVGRRLGTFDMGLDVDDATQGRLGLRMGGMIRGYKVSLDVSDVVNNGRIGFQLRRTK